MSETRPDAQAAQRAKAEGRRKEKRKKRNKKIIAKTKEA